MNVMPYLCLLYISVLLLSSVGNFRLNVMFLLWFVFSANPNKKEKLQHFREIVKALPVPNRDTLEFLLRHLLRLVTVIYV